MTEQELASLYEEADNSEETVSRLEQLYREYGRIILAELLLLFNADSAVQEFQTITTLRNVDEAVDELYEKMADEIKGNLLVIYVRTLKDTRSPVTDISPDLIQAIIEKAWASDGKSFTNRMRTHAFEVKQALRVKLLEILEQGKREAEILIPKAVKVIQREYSKHFYRVDAVTRTETNRLINEAIRFSFERQGYDGYEYSAILDSRTSGICRSLNGNVYSFIEAQHGVNYPPLHPFVEVSSSL